VTCRQPSAVHSIASYSGGSSCRKRLTSAGDVQAGQNVRARGVRCCVVKGMASIIDAIR